MHDNQYPPCIVRTAPQSTSMPIELRFLTVNETENLLDNQEELIGTPMKIVFESTVSRRNHFSKDQSFVSFAILEHKQRNYHRRDSLCRQAINAS